MTMWQTWRQVYHGRAPSMVAREGARLEDIADLSVLAEAWGRVRANKGGPGGDGVTIEGMAPRIDAELEALSTALLSQRYRPGRLRRAFMKKPMGGRRPLSIPSVIDRIAQTAALIALDPDLDARMSETSWAYRAGRGVPGALAAVRQAYAAGLVWTVDADIRAYFDQIPRRRLLQDLAIWIDDERVIRLIGLWLTSFGGWGRGIAQGAPISPLLANLYLHPVDRLLWVEGYRSIRYADDLVVMAADEGAAEAGLTLLARLLRERGLELNREKTRILQPGAELAFLGEKVRVRGLGDRSVGEGPAEVKADGVVGDPMYVAETTRCNR